MVGCMIAAVLAVAAGGVTVYAGWSYLSRKIPEWEARYPWFAVARHFLASGSDEGIPALAQPGGKEPGETDPALLPDDVVLHPRPLEEAVSIGEDFVVAYQEVGETVAAAVADLRSRWRDRGWRLEDDGPTPGGTVLLFSKGDRSCTVEILEGQGVTEVWLRCSRYAEETP